MRLLDFKVEQWMNEYEGQAVYNLTDTCAKSLTLEELLSSASLDFHSLYLDYGSITGDISTKEKILSLYQSGTIDHLTTMHGCLEANTIVMETLLEPGDHVITYVPGYQQFYDLPRSLGCEVSLVSLNPKKEWKASAQEFITLIQANTKMIILNNPSNPTGVTFDDSFLKELVDACKDRQIYILCDEVYRGFGNETSISDIYLYGISTSSLSKVFGLAGLRFGWIKADPKIIHEINVRRDYTMISTGPLIDTFANVALENKDVLIQRNRNIIDQNKETIKRWLESDKNFLWTMPESGTVGFLQYTFDMKSEELAKRLLKETGIFFVPGACFDCEYHLRLGLAQDPEMVKEGLERLSIWVKTNIG